jgi:pimeloyl-ACP methyl ester carboxylesterase
MGAKRDMSVTAGGADKRPRGVLGLFWASLEAAAAGRAEHRPTAALYPPSVVRRVTFEAGGGHGWRLSALTTPRSRPAPWKYVVITGAPSWAEYWAPVLAALPADREMVVVDRPGFAGSEPAGCVADIRQQAAALAPLLVRRRGQKIVLVGQSYGAAIAALMAAEAPGSVASLVLLSSYLGESGPTASWLVKTGLTFLKVIPRDLRHATLEVAGHAAQMPLMRAALLKVRAPIHLIHGEADDFAPIEAARRLAAEIHARNAGRFHAVAGATHFLNDGEAQAVIAALEACVPAPRPAFAWRWPKWSLFPAAKGVLQAG